MDVFIEKAKVKKVLRRKEYQEVFFKSRLLNGSKSLKIYDCEKDIASLLKKYRFKKEAENLKNLLNAARFAC